MKNPIFTLKVTPNHSARTFTIREYVNGKISTKYRTVEMNKEEFEVKSKNTENDWKNFLRNSYKYNVV